MASIEQPKKAPSGYWLFLSEKREEIVKTLGTAKGSEVSKKGGEIWKALGEEERKPYEEKANKLKLKYEEDLKAFKEGGGVVTRKSKKNKEEETKRDPNAPKKPAGGGYGRFLAEHREEIVQSLPKDHKITDVSKAAGARWKELSEEEKARYTATFLEKMEEYKKAKEEYDASHPKEQPAAVSSTPKKATKKRGAEDSGEKKAPAGKKPRASTKDSSKDVIDEIDPEVLAEAKKLGLELNFKNLVSRAEIAALSMPANKMLSALKDNDGLVNRTKHVLLGGA